MPRLYMITVPGLDVKSDWRVIHDRLLDDFPKVSDVLPTTSPQTLLIVYRGQAGLDEWLDSVSQGILFRRMQVQRRTHSASPALTDSPAEPVNPTRKGIPA